MNTTESDFKPIATPVLEKYGPLLYRICVSVIHDSYYAEDAVSETLLRYYSSAPKFRSEVHEKSWLIRVARNVSIDIVRYRKRHTHVSIETVPEEFLAVSENAEESSAILFSLFSLPEIYSTVVWLYYGEKMDTSSIAKTLGISNAAARKRLSRGRELLKAKYEGRKEGMS